MYRLLIHIGNGLWLVLVLIGVPTITSTQFGKIRLSAAPEFQTLTLGGLGIGAIANLLGGWMARGKQRSLYWKWASVHVAALLAYYLVFSGNINFQWLKDALLWLKKAAK